jgi:hypothetical protein
MLQRGVALSSKSMFTIWQTVGMEAWKEFLLDMKVLFILLD